MKNNDWMIHHTLYFQQSKQIDIPSILGKRFESINIFYSNPAYYTKQKNLETKRWLEAKNSSHWETKTDDFFPYADFDHGYWTGYFVSRAGFKKLERAASSFLMAARQIESYQPHNTRNFIVNTSHPLYSLEDALGVVQHHDAISGTAKQHVANDYAKRVSGGVAMAASFVAHKIRHIFLEDGIADRFLQDFGYCPLLNETICEISEIASKNKNDLYVFAYNALGTGRSVIIGIPVSSPGVYAIQQAVRAFPDHDDITAATVDVSGTHVIYFKTSWIPPTGALAYILTALSDDHSKSEFTSQLERRLTHEGTQLSNEFTKLEFINDTAYRITNIEDGSDIELSHRWGYYTSFDDTLDSPTGSQNSGAYIFRPSTSNQNLTIIAAVKSEIRKISNLFDEVIVTYEVPWIQQVMRLYKDSTFIEIEYTVGPIPIDDGRGKEIISQFLTTIDNQGVFFTDSNGREFQERIRSKRQTWNLTEFEPIAGNFYPVNAAVYIEDKTKSFCVVTDRSQGGSSLKDGNIEIMVQRRTLRDDSRGVAEALNETNGFINPYPPYGDSTRHGNGVVIRGKHRIMIGQGNRGASMSRSIMDESFSEPLILVGSEKAGTDVPFQVDSFSLITNELPKNIMLITFKRLTKSNKNTFLIRLGHQFGVKEDPILSEPVPFDLSQMFQSGIVDCKEKTLSGNRDIELWKLDKLDWIQEDSFEVPSISCSQHKTSILLRPMEIRTFYVTVS
jgi:Glycosyl hydrolases family 38 C-terminal domain/Alpha mannosidase middle domain/Glycosyl hydrolases family 38 C-terminal beta sandwich domain